MPDHMFSGFHIPRDENKKNVFFNCYGGNHYPGVCCMIVDASFEKMKIFRENTYKNIRKLVKSMKRCFCLKTKGLALP